MIAALAAVIHNEEALLVKVLDLLLVPHDVFVMLILVLLLLLWLKLIPELAALLHSFGMSATLLLLQLVYILGGVKQVS